MKATAFEFRFRVWIIVAAIALGFWSPWIEPLGWERANTTWGWLGFQLNALHFTSLSGVVMVTWLAIAAAAGGAWLRIWGTATLGAEAVHHNKMQADVFTANGPYRYVRNPLYLGTLLMLSAIAVVMPPTGALMMLVLLGVFQFRLTLAEEAFLTAKLGHPYEAYLKAVPRLIPALRSRVTGTCAKPRWGHALVAELMPVGVLVCFASLSWLHHDLIQRGLLISFGLSLVGKALLPAPKSQPTA